MTPEEFRERRKALGETQVALAERLGVTRRCVQRYEAGERKISRTVAMLLSSLSPRESRTDSG